MDAEKKVKKDWIPILALIFSIVSFYYSALRESAKGKVIIESASSHSKDFRHQSSLIFINSGNVDMLINNVSIIVPTSQDRKDSVELDCADGVILKDSTPRVIKPGEIVALPKDRPYDLRCYWEHAYEVEVKTDTIKTLEDGEHLPAFLPAMTKCRKIEITLEVEGAFGNGDLISERLRLSELYYVNDKNSSEPVRLHENNIKKGRFMNLGKNWKLSLY